jgi:hypothetical protein
MSSFKDLINEKPSATFRNKVLSSAQGELKAIRTKKAVRNFWILALSSAASLGIVSWFTHKFLQGPKTSNELLAAQDNELIEDIDLLEDLELFEELEKEGIEI